MKSAIIDKGESGYTLLGKIFNAIDNEQVKYNWLVTNCECYPQDQTIYDMFLKEYVWISGEQLTDIIQQQDFQFVWAVFSGFSLEISLDDVLKYKLPYADGYKGFWTDEVGIQHPLAEVEIVAFDSSLTLFISKKDELTQKFMRGFPLSEDLLLRNRRDNAQIAHIQDLLVQELTKRKIQIDNNIVKKKYVIWHMIKHKGNEIDDKDILAAIEENFK